MMQLQFVITALAIGVGIPILWLVIYWAFLKGNPSLLHSVMSIGRLDQVLLAVWPSSVLLIADPEDRSVTIPAISIAVNAVLYAGVGWLVWFGLYRNRIVLGLTILALVAGWYCIFTWYAGR